MLVIKNGPARIGPASGARGDDAPAVDRRLQKFTGTTPISRQ